jgi:DNA mismatch repair protein MutS
MASAEKTATPVISQYLQIKERHQEELLFFRMGDFYELLFDDARVASKSLDIALTKRGRYQNQDIPMCGVPVHAHENYISRLIRQGHRVAVCEQLIPSLEDSGGTTLPLLTSKIIPRDVVRIITPGTLTEESLMDAKRHNFLAAVYSGKNFWGVAALDMSTGFFMTDRIVIEDMASWFQRWAPREILIPQNIWDQEQNYNLWSSWKTAVRPWPQARFHIHTGTAALKRFFGLDTLEGLGALSSEEIITSGVILDYVILTQKSHIPKISLPHKSHSQEFMIVDHSTWRNLELSETRDGQTVGSLLHALDSTVTASGGRLLSHWMINPLKDNHMIEDRLHAVSFFKDHPKHRNDFRNIVESWPDVERILSRIHLQRYSPRDMGALREGIRLLPALQNILYSCKRDDREQLIDKSILWDIMTHFDTHPVLLGCLEQALCEELPAVFREGNFIRDGFDVDLDNYRKLQIGGSVLIKNLQIQYIQETGISSLRIRHNTVIGYFIEVTSQHASKVPYTFLLRQNLSGNCRYVTKELLNVAKNLEESGIKSIEREQIILETLRMHILNAEESLRKTVQQIALIDVLANFAHLAHEYHYIKPHMVSESILHIEQGRHPVLERLMPAQSFQSNSCILGAYEPNTPSNSDTFIFSKPNAYLLTGPNMGGKSTFLRQNAHIILMAHMGCFVPASQATIGIVDRLFSRIGAHDDMVKGYSTFMVEMIETAAILNQATHQSFVILDEMGRGTSPEEGWALAQACLEDILNRIQCRMLFATHYHDLFPMHQIPHTLQAWTFEFHNEQGYFIPLYKMIMGIAEHSYGLETARKAGIPPQVLQAAQDYFQARSFLAVQKQHSDKDFSEIKSDSKGLSLLTLNKQNRITIIKDFLKGWPVQSMDHMTPRQALDSVYELMDRYKNETISQDSSHSIKG